MVVIATYFLKKRPVAYGIAACGSVTGGLIFPSMVRTLLPTDGFGWTMRAIGIVQLGTLAVAVAAVNPRLGAEKVGHVPGLVCIPRNRVQSVRSRLFYGTLFPLQGCKSLLPSSLLIDELRLSHSSAFFSVSSTYHLTPEISRRRHTRNLSTL
jgi:hypothetical protein